MADEKEFYIGWQNEMPAKNKNFLKKIILGIFIVLPILVLAVVFLQKPFNDHIFEFGKITNVTGTYFSKPIPMLIADAGQFNPEISNNLLLVGFGKFGAEGIMATIEKSEGELSGKKIILAGTLIHGESKSLLELTNEEESLIEILNNENAKVENVEIQSELDISGEILDPKCYFGVMKPGQGKVHKSCAARCISGGIPPVIQHRTQDPNLPFKYYILLNKKGEKINKDLLPFVAENIKVKANTAKFYNWDIAYIDPSTIKLLKTMETNKN